MQYHLLLDVAHILTQYHDTGHIHCDMKWANIFMKRMDALREVARGGNWCAKGADHGTMAKKEARNVAVAAIAGTGTPSYMAPEVEAQAGAMAFASVESDMHAVGGMVWTVAHHTTWDDAFTKWNGACAPACLCRVHAARRAGPEQQHY